MPRLNVKENALATFQSWYSAQPVYKKLADAPANSTIGAALFILEKLKSQGYCLDFDAHVTKGKGQIAGLSGQGVGKVLAAFGETRPFLKEVRTSRGVMGAVKSMLNALQSCKLDLMPAPQRNEVLTDMQSFLVERVRAYHSQQRLRFDYDPSKTTWQAISDLMSEAKTVGKDGMVAQYLVGAKLKLRFPNLEIQNFSYSTADAQLGRPGDFYVGNTAFHVTVAPMQGVFNRCHENIAQGYRVYLLVPDAKLEGARQLAGEKAAGKIAVESIESFVSQNVEELSEFASKQVLHGFRRLLETYNLRVNEVESDKSLLIQIPPNLQD